ncbi:hypothetical protein SAMN05444414_13918 [Roseovarius marisflavi]|uniref:Uncharacterized protein n=1 Tax=Roseovarius marisflavi TaxID=1054996 RepID=A0A1M7DDH9_9RHOB|nr:hypothetical protein [Roseovarius marisflavi]SHL77534.1 hypothetical protein SAMN05444414_13918 [Roseovarius marisflavi]
MILKEVKSLCHISSMAVVLSLPGFDDRLSDEEAATLATFLRQAWCNKVGAVSSADVADLRDKEVANQADIAQSPICTPSRARLPMARSMSCL